MRLAAIIFTTSYLFFSFSAIIFYLWSCTNSVQSKSSKFFRNNPWIESICVVIIKYLSIPSFVAFVYLIATPT
ncbi:hypothetical protein EC840_11914 [Rahnella sp. JUb53]|nr:hypothetical protein EC840_11914 [Rahnella sp. JUb53]